MVMDKKGIVDKTLEKIFSRKLLVFSVATYLTLSSNLESSDWTFIALMYIGIQGAIDLYEKRHSQ